MEDKYIIKFYYGSTLLTTSNSNQKKFLTEEFKRFDKMTVKEIEKELGLNTDLTVTTIEFVDNETGNILTEYLI